MTTTEVEAAALAEQFDATRRSRRVDGGDFILDEPDLVPAVWGSGEEVLWAEGEGFMLAGHQGLGKTTLAQQLVLAMIGVKPDTFLGYPVKSVEGSILYLAMDRPRQAARSFRRMVQEPDRATLNSRLMVWRGPLPVNPVERGAFAAWIREICPEVAVVVVDSVKDLAPGTSDDAVASALSTSWQDLIADGIEVLLLHHQRKGTKDTPRSASLDSIYGSTWLTSGLGSVGVLTGEPGSDEVVLHHVKQPAETVGPLDVKHDGRAGESSCNVGAQRMSFDAALSLATPDGHSVASLVALTGLSAKTVRSRLGPLVDAGVVEKLAGQNTSKGRGADTFRHVGQGGEMLWS